MTESITDVLVVLFGSLLGAAIFARMRGWAPSWSAHAEADLELPVGRTDAFARAQLALTGLGTLGTPLIDAASGSIEAEVRGGWRTAGDLVTLQVDEIDANRTRVRIRSRPILPQAFDWGANRKRVEGLRRTLEGLVR